MRVDLFEIRLDNSSAIYIAGNSVTGSVAIKLTKTTLIDSISLRISGRAKSKWEVSNGDTSKRYQAREVYIDSNYSLYQNPNRLDRHQIGTHVYPFEFDIPPEVPSSFEGRRGYVVYDCFVSMDLGWKGMMEIEQRLIVIRHLDLAAIPRAAMPQSLHEEEMYEGCCCDSGTVAASLRLQKSGFVSGEPMHYEIAVDNQATSTIFGISLYMVQLVQYTGFSDSIFSSGNPKYHTKVNEWNLYHSDDEILAGKSMVLNNFCIIPAVSPSLLEGCNIIDISYEIHMKVPVGWRTIHMNCGVFIGTIPLRLPATLSNSSSFDLDLSPPIRQNFELPPSYEECVFGRMESQEGNGDVDDMDDRNNSNEDAQGRNSTTVSRRPHLHRLPSYPYYDSSHFSESGAYISSQPTHAHNSQTDQPLPITSPPSETISTEPSDQTHLLQTEETELPPPPSYDSLQLGAPI